MKIHIKKQNTLFGFNQYFKPGGPGTFSPGLSILKLTNTPYTFESGKTEVFILLLSGEMKVYFEGTKKEYTFKRSSVFEDLPSGIYIPPENKITIESLSESTEAAFCYSSQLYRAKNEEKNLTVLPKNKDDIIVKDVGKGCYKRNVRTVCGINDETYSLIIGETVSEGGMWSSYPPHRHEKNEMPHENKLKEIYYYRIDPPQGFAFQGLYSVVSKTESAFMVKDGDAIFIANGFHPVSAAPGYHLYYLWILCGQVPSLAWKVDENHEWM